MHGDMVADILRGEGFVSGHEIALAEPEILYEDRIAGKGCLAGVTQLQAPRPEVLRWVQPEGGAVVQLMGFACPNEPVAPGAETCSRAGANGFRRPRFRSQENAPDGAAQRRAQRLVQHRTAAAVIVLDGEQAAVWQGGDLKPRRVPDPEQAKLALARRAEGSPAQRSLPSSCPSPHGRGDGVASAERNSSVLSIMSAPCP